MDQRRAVDTVHARNPHVEGSAMSLQPEHCGKLTVQWVVGTGSYILQWRDRTNGLLHNCLIDEATASRIYLAAARELAEMRSCRSAAVGQSLGLETG